MNDIRNAALEAAAVQAETWDSGHCTSSYFHYGFRPAEFCAFSILPPDFDYSHG